MGERMSETTGVRIETSAGHRSKATPLPERLEITRRLTVVSGQLVRAQSEVVELTRKLQRQRRWLWRLAIALVAMIVLYFLKH